METTPDKTARGPGGALLLALTAALAGFFLGAAWQRSRTPWRVTWRDRDFNPGLLQAMAETEMAYQEATRQIGVLRATTPSRPEGGP